MKNISVLYFGILREQRGQPEESLQTTAKSISELFSELKAQHGLTHSLDQLRTARNEEFCPPATALANGDTIALMPPMAGG